MKSFKKQFLVCLSIPCLLLVGCESTAPETGVAFETVEAIDDATILPKNFQGYWAPWMTDNPNGTERDVHFLQGLNPNAIGLKVREQGGYGVINMSMIGRTEFGVLVQTDWTTTNTRGVIKEKSFSNSRTDYATTIELKEQYGYGVVDARLISQRNIATGWVTQNPNVNRYHRYNCMRGYKIVGISTKEQSGYGVVDVRVFVKKI